MPSPMPCRPASRLIATPLAAKARRRNPGTGEGSSRVTEDTFRIVVAAAVALACIAFVVQAAAMFALYRVAGGCSKRSVRWRIGPNP